MRSPSVVAAFTVLLSVAAAPSAGAQQPATPLEVVVLEPAPGSVTLRPVFRVRASVKAEGEVTAEVVIEWPHSPHRAIPMRRLEDGTYAADGVTVRAPVSVRVRDRAGTVTRVAVEVVDRSGYGEHVSIFSPGTPLRAVQTRDVAGKPLSIPPAPTLTLVFFYSAWDDCDVELAWLEGIRRAYGPLGLTIIGVASVGPDDVAAWRRHLEEREVSWQNVADGDGAVAAGFELPPRKSVGNADVGVVIYLTRDAKVADGSYVSADQLSDENKDDEAARYINRALDRLLRPR